MNVPKSDPLIEAVAELRRMFPDFRFARLVLAVACSAGAMEPGEVYDVEDDALLAAARHMIDFNPERREIAASGTYADQPRISWAASIKYRNGTH